MNFTDALKKFWKFLKEDTWQSWLVSLILAFAIIKFIFFPVLSFAMGTPLPLVVVESCSMYHAQNFDDWWDGNAPWYERKQIYKYNFTEFPFKEGLNKGDIILVSGRGSYNIGDVIIFESGVNKFPLIHRLVQENPLGTKGDKNFDQIEQERNIPENMVLGKSLIRIPGLGWVKLIFFEGLRKPEERGFCR